MKKLCLLSTLLFFIGCANLTKQPQLSSNNHSISKKISYDKELNLKLSDIQKPYYIYDLKINQSISTLSMLEEYNDEPKKNLQATKKKSVMLINTELTKLNEPKLDTSSLLPNKELKLNYNITADETEEYNIPITMTPRVEKYIERFTGPSRNTMQKWITNSYKYIFFIKDLFQNYGLPADLAYLPLAESGFEPTVRSRAGAVGMWQFMESTGRLYGLKVNYWVDERKDFEKSTHAAAKHLKDLYEKFGDWNLALAAYNAGAGRIQRAIDKFNSEDYFELTGYKHLAEETKDYVPKYFALMKIHKNLLRYGFKFPEVEPLVYEKVDLNFPVNLQVLSKITGIEMNEIIELNPSLRRWVTPPNDTFTLKIPLGYKEKVELALKEYSPEELLQVKIYTPKKRERIVDIAKKYKINPSQITSFNGIKKQIVRAGFPVLIPVGSTKTLVTPDKLDEVTKNVVDRETGSIKTYVVKKGDTLFSIAKKHKTTVDTIKRVNNIKALKVGMTLEIPTKKYVSKTVKKDRNKNSKSKFLLHTVKKGDTIYKLANKYDTKPDYIIKINKTKTLIPGKTIKIPRSNI